MRRLAPSEVRSLSIEPVEEKTRAQSAAIVNQVKEGGVEALLEIACKFGDLAEGASWRLGRAVLSDLRGSQVPSGSWTGRTWRWLGSAWAVTYKPCSRVWRTASAFSPAPSVLLS
jgi:hypothetical protein